VADSTVRVRADLAQLRQDLQAAAGLSEGQAQAMVISLERRIKAAEQAAKAQAKAIKDATKAAKDFDDKVKGAADGAKRAFLAVGGQAGAMAGKVENAVRSVSELAEVVGPAGLGAAGVVVGIAAIGTALFAIAEAGEAARARLEAAGLAAEIPPEALRGLDEYSAGTHDLRVAVDELEASLGGAVGDDLALLTHNLALLVDAAAGTAGWLGTLKTAIVAIGTGGASVLIPAVADAVKEFDDWHESLENTWQVVKTGIPTLGELESWYRKNEGAVLDLEAAENKATDALKKQRDAIDDLVKKHVTLHVGSSNAAQDIQILADLFEHEKTSAKGAADAAAEVNAGLKEQHEEEAAVAAQSKKLQEAVDLAAQEQRLFALGMEQSSAASQALVSELDDLVPQLEDMGDALIAAVTAASLQKPYEDLADTLGKYGSAIDAAIGAFGDLGQAIETLNNDRIDQLEEVATKAEDSAKRQADAEFDRQKEAIDGELERGTITGKEAAARMMEIEAEHRAGLHAAKHLGDTQRAEALKAFKANQKLQIAQATIESIRAGISLIPSFSAIPFGGGIALATAAAAAAEFSAVSAIRAQDPPEFSAGRLPGASSSPDHTMVGSFRDDEAVLTNRGVANVGGRDGVRAVNERGLGPPVVQVFLGRRMVAQQVGARTRPDPRRGKRDPNRGGG
jgi:hypothetical protein